VAEVRAGSEVGRRVLVVVALGSGSGSAVGDVLGGGSGEGPACPESRS
jgi:hypothetical protein